jgi:hypothetical protein
MEGNMFNPIKDISDKNKDDIILSEEILNAIPLKPRTKLGCHFSLFIFSFFLKNLRQQYKIREVNKRNKYWKEKMLLLFTYSMTVSTEKPVSFKITNTS